MCILFLYLYLHKYFYNKNIRNIYIAIIQGDFEVELTSGKSARYKMNIEHLKKIF